MQRWGVKPTTEKRVSQSHLALAVLAVLGFGLILVTLAVPVFSAVPTPVGHDAAQVGAGTFFGTPTDTWTVPGRISTLNATVQSVLTIGAATAWEVFVDPTGYLGLRTGPSNPALWMIKTNGDVGIGLTNPATKLDVFGTTHSSTDVCYGDSADGKCLSDLSGVPYVNPTKKIQIACNPSSCDYDSSVDLTTPAFDPEGDNEGTLLASCPAGTVVLSCGGGVKADTAGEFVKGYSIRPEYSATYSSPGDSMTGYLPGTSSGCQMDWRVGSGSQLVRGYVRAACISIYP